MPSSGYSYTLAGPFARADVRWYGTGAVLTGHLAGERVCRVFGGSDSEREVFAWASALAFNGVWPREVKPRSGTTGQWAPVLMELRGLA